jgi:sarcosine oxidase
MAPGHDVAIVGAGLLGLAAAGALAARGRDFVLLEQAGIGHQGAGSKGSCRIFRIGYPDADYVTAARCARELWLQLEAQADRKILLPTPQLTFGPRLTSVREAMRRAGAPCELLTAGAVAERFPDVRVGGPALLETESCVIAADAALAALAAAAGLGANAGVGPDAGLGTAGPAGAGGPAGAAGPDAGRIRTGVRVTGVADDGRQVTLQTGAGVVTARTAIITAGPWTAGLLPGQLSVPTSATLEQVAYLAPTGPHQRPAPIFLCYGEQSPYGLPVPGSDRYKIGIHPSGPPVSPDAQDQSPDPVLIARLAEVAARYLPGYQPDPIATERCIYDNTPDDDFIVDRIGNIVIGCGTSGHGFKFGPLFGEWLAALATGSRQAEAADSTQWISAAGPGGRFRLARLTAGSAPETR